METDSGYDDTSASDFDKNDFTNVGLDPFDDPQDIPVASKDDPIEANSDKESIKLTLRRKSEEEHTEYYKTSKSQSQENQNNVENNSE